LTTPIILGGAKHYNNPLQGQSPGGKCWARSAQIWQRCKVKGAGLLAQREARQPSQSAQMKGPIEQAVMKSRSIVVMSGSVFVDMTLMPCRGGRVNRGW